MGEFSNRRAVASGDAGREIRCETAAGTFGLDPAGETGVESGASEAPEMTPTSPGRAEGLDVTVSSSAVAAHGNGRRHHSASAPAFGSAFALSIRDPAVTGDFPAL